MIGVPVRCPQCSQYTFVIRLRDKYFCIHPTCSNNGRLPTVADAPVNLSMERYYIMELEQLACKVLDLDYFALRRDGTIQPATKYPEPYPQESRSFRWYQILKKAIGRW